MILTYDFILQKKKNFFNFKSLNSTLKKETVDNFNSKFDIL